MKRAGLAIVVLYALHQDFWFWKTATPFVFGVLPIGLAYHAAYMILTAAVLAWLVSSHWPAHLDDESNPLGPVWRRGEDERR
jgi:hypothetical protein